MTEVLGEFLADPMVGLAGTALGIALVALWLAAAWWAYRDASRRAENHIAPLIVAGWIVVSTPLLLPLSLLIYVVVRPEPTAERRARRLVAELGYEQAAVPQCRSCGAGIDATWLRCPYCAWWLASPCSGCGTWSDRDLPACPWCGSEERKDPAVQDLTPQPSWLSPRSRRARVTRAAMAPGSPRIPRLAHRRITDAANGRPIAAARFRP